MNSKGDVPEKGPTLEDIRTKSTEELYCKNQDSSEFKQRGTLIFTWVPCFYLTFIQYSLKYFYDNFTS